jgi:hypothetical protein
VSTATVSAAADALEPTSSRALQLIGSVVAPTTLLTSLMFYFGRGHAYWFFAHFGVNFTVMGLTPTDYLIRGADGLFMPLTVALGLGLLSLWAYRSARARLSSRAWRTITRIAAPVATAAGGLLAATAAVAALRPVAFYAFPGVPGMCLALGVVLLSVTAHRRGRASAGEPATVAVAEWGAAFLLVSIGLFWAVTDYSASVGVGRAVQVEAGLATQPAVTLYSKENLGITTPGVHRTVCATTGFRYDGLRLVLEAGGQYFLLPATWRPDAGTALVVPRTGDLHLEFTTAATPPVC